MDEQRRRGQENRVHVPLFGARLLRSFPGRSLLFLPQSLDGADGFRGLSQTIFFRAPPSHSGGTAAQGSRSARLCLAHVLNMWPCDQPQVDNSCHISEESPVCRILLPYKVFSIWLFNAGDLKLPIKEKVDEL